MAQRQFRSDDTSRWKDGFGNGADGAVTVSTNTTDAPIDSACSGTAGTNSLSATNASFATGKIIMIHQTRGTNAGTWELNKIASYTSGTITTVYPLTYSYTSSGSDCAQVLVLERNTDFTVNGSVTLTAKAWNGTVGGILGILANGTVTVTGALNAQGLNASGATIGNGIGFRGGTSPETDAQQGEGTAGAGTRSELANGNGAGASLVDNGSASGGGNGTAGSSGSRGAVGAAAGNAGLTNMVFGGGGGGEGTGGTSSAGGGGGGGIVIIIAPTVTISGSVYLKGGMGGGASNGTGASGSGAGGSVLIKTRVATLGTNLVNALGGVAYTANSYDGGAGGDGRIHLDYSSSYTGSTTPTLDPRNDLTLRNFSIGLFMPSRVGQRR